MKFYSVLLSNPVRLVVCIADIWRTMKFCSAFGLAKQPRKFCIADFWRAMEFCSAFGLAKQTRKFCMADIWREMKFCSAFGLAKQPRTFYVAAAFRRCPPITLQSTLAARSEPASIP